MTTSTTLEFLLRRDRIVIGVSLLGIVILAWVYLLLGAGMDMSMPGMAMAPMAWSAATAFLMFAMWWIMMIAMMVPSAAPIILLYSAIGRRHAGSDRPVFGAGVFVAGYLVTWAIFSVIATLLQWGVEQLELMAMDMSIGSHVVGGAILLTAGLYQFVPMKTSCLQHCQNPAKFLGSHWRPGVRGAFHMGFVHGAYCVGCCWLLMGLLFVGGIMNLLWIAGLAAYVLLEKLLSEAPWLGRAAGVSLVASGVLLLASPN